eukprot:768381-Hanusia_phi.AAC.8
MRRSHYKQQEDGEAGKQTGKQTGRQAGRQADRKAGKVKGNVRQVSRKCKTGNRRRQGGDLCTRLSGCNRHRNKGNLVMLNHKFVTSSHQWGEEDEESKEMQRREDDSPEDDQG